MELPQTHQVTYRVRFDEADASGHLRPSGLLRYTQDLAWQHSEAAGFDRAWYDARGTFWLVRMASLRIWRPADYGDHLRATTQVTGWRRVWARRHTSFDAEDGQPIAEADTDWVLLTSAGRPAQIPDEISRHFAPGRRYKPDAVKLGAPTAAQHVLKTTVAAAQIDPLGHLNNAAYLDIVDAAMLPLMSELAMPIEYRVEYIRPMLAGASLRAVAWVAPDGSLACQLLDEAGAEVCRAIVGYAGGAPTR